MTRFLTLTIIFLLPLNLGKHFVFNWNYINGLLVDYLVPTVYVQDVLIFVVIILWFFDLLVHKKRVRLFGWSGRLLVFFLVVTGLSVLSAISINAGIHAYLRLLLYVLFAFFVGNTFDFKRDFQTAVKVLAVSCTLLGVLALGQWLKQGAVFNNYLFFGEQPYTYSTFGIVKVQFLGRSVVPVYGTFRHPNVYGGFLSVVLLWFVWTMPLLKAPRTKALVGICIVLNVFVLLLTFSFTAFAAFILGLAWLILTSKYGKRGFVYSLMLLGVCIMSVFLLPRFADAAPFFGDSFTNRVVLNTAALAAINKAPFLFGVGLNNFLLAVPVTASIFGGLKFPQPVHNIYLLMLLETGFFSLVFFSAFIVSTFGKHFTRPNFFVLSLMQLLVLGLFDHYVLTIHHGMLLLWLTVGFYFAYNSMDVHKT